MYIRASNTTLVGGGSLAPSAAARFGTLGDAPMDSPYAVMGAVNAPIPTGPRAPFPWKLLLAAGAIYWLATRGGSTMRRNPAGPLSIFIRAGTSAPSSTTRKRRRPRRRRYQPPLMSNRQARQVAKAIKAKGRGRTEHQRRSEAMKAVWRRRRAQARRELRQLRAAREEGVAWGASPPALGADLPELLVERMPRTFRPTAEREQLELPIR